MAYGFKLVKAQEPIEYVSQVVTSGTTITAGDPVYQNDGALSLAVGAGYYIYGIAQETVVGDGTLKCTFHVVKEGDVWEIDNDNDSNTFGGSGYRDGKTYDLTGATGAVQVDTSSASTSNDKQVACVKYNPSSSDTSLGWFVVSERPTSDVAA